MSKNDFSSHDDYLHGVLIVLENSNVVLFPPFDGELETVSFYVSKDGFLASFLFNKKLKFTFDINFYARQSVFLSLLFFLYLLKK